VRNGENRAAAHGNNNAQATPAVVVAGRVTLGFLHLKDSTRVQARHNCKRTHTHQYR